MISEDPWRSISLKESKEICQLLSPCLPMQSTCFLSCWFSSSNSLFLLLIIVSQSLQVGLQSNSCFFSILDILDQIDSLSLYCCWLSMLSPNPHIRSGLAITLECTIGLLCFLLPLSIVSWLGLWLWLVLNRELLQLTMLLMFSLPSAYPLIQILTVLYLSALLWARLPTQLMTIAYTQNPCALSVNNGFGLNLQAIRKAMIGQLFILFLIYFAGQIYKTVKTKQYITQKELGENPEPLRLPWNEKHWNRNFPVIFANNAIAMGFCLLFSPSIAAVILSFCHLIGVAGYVVGEIKIRPSISSAGLSLCNLINIALMVTGLVGIKDADYDSDGNCKYIN